MSHLTQMAGLAVQNFVSAAVGIAVAVALVRGLAPAASETIGNFWVDLVRDDDARPAAAVGRRRAPAGEPGRRAERSRSSEAHDRRGRDAVDLPAARSRARRRSRSSARTAAGSLQRELGAPVREPTAFTNLVEMLGAAAASRSRSPTRSGGWSATSGRAGRSSRRCSCSGSGRRRSPRTSRSSGNPQPQPRRRGGEHGGQGGALRRARARRSSPPRRPARRPGAVNAAHDSFTPRRRRGAAREHDARRGRPGGVGAGLYGMLVFALLAVFIAGLMVGRTPEYLGKKIQAAEMKLVVALPARRADARPRLLGAPSVLLDAAKSSILNPGPHGLSEVVYAFTSAANNNGSAFGGLTGEHRLVQHDARPGDAGGRFLLIVPRARDRGLARAQAAGPGDRGHVPDRHAALRRAARRRRPDRRRRSRTSPSSRSGPIVEQLGL